MANNKGKGLQNYGFEISKPIKQGTLMKQGALHKAFKYRFFVLYPGFLVYYEDQGRWKLDVSRGDTLQSRQGAIKLRNGSCNIARQAPKGCKFGLIVHGPDPQNKRPTYLLNAASKEDRDMWIEAIRQGTPHSPKAGRKNEAKPDPKKKEEESVQPPKYTQRQETVDLAAQVASEEASKNVEESITSIDEELAAGVAEPSLSTRRDTTNSAALSLTSQEKSTNMVDLTEEDEPVISIDDVLGPADDCSEADVLDSDKIAELECDEGAGQDEEASETPESNEMESKSNISLSSNEKGDTEVVTSVVVVCNSDGNEVGGNERGEESPASDRKSTSASTSSVSEPSSSLATQRHADTLNTGDEGSTSAEVIVPGSDERHNSFTINTTALDSDTDNDGDGSTISACSPPPVDHNREFETPVGSSGPAITVDGTACEEVKAKESREVKQNGELKENGELKQNGEVNENCEVKENGGPSVAAEAKLNPGPAYQQGRKMSTPFIQKVGYLYKMGGHRKNWKLRYFVLNPGVFFYYKNPKSTKPLGEVKLKNSRIFFPGSGERKTSYQFTLHTESQWNKRQDWVIAAQSEREMKEWVDAFKAAGQKSSPTCSPTGSDGES